LRYLPQHVGPAKPAPESEWCLRDHIDTLLETRDGRGDRLFIIPKIAQVNDLQALLSERVEIFSFMTQPKLTKNLQIG
jgi:hypothetical protein